MEKLSLELFLSAVYDFEKSQRQFTNTLRYYSQQFRYYRLYPFLKVLIDVSEIIDLVANKKSYIESTIQQLIQNSIPANTENEFEHKSYFECDINQVYDFINWANPQIQDVIEEGKVIYNFVKQNLFVEQIGTDQKNKNNGIFFITNKNNDSIQVYHYHIPFLWGGVNSSTLMRAFLINSFSKEQSFQDLLDIVGKEINYEFPYLLNNAVFKIECDLDFPFEETILPIAKRRLLKRMST